MPGSEERAGDPLAPTHEARPEAEERGSAEGERLVFVRLTYELPHDHWGYQFTTAHPDLRADVSNWMTLPDGRVIGEFFLSGTIEAGLEKEIRQYAAVSAVLSQSAVGRPSHYRVLFSLPPDIALAESLRVLFGYPRVYQNGVHRCQIIEPLDRVRELVARLRSISPSVKISGLRYQDLGVTSAQLTPEQARLLRAALAAGYFEVPRKVTLTQLAKRLGRSKAAVSVSLAKAEKKMAEAAAASGI